MRIVPDRTNENEEKVPAAGPQLYVWRCYRCNAVGSVVATEHEDFVLMIPRMDRQHQKHSPQCMNPLRRLECRYD